MRTLLLFLLTIPFFSNAQPIELPLLGQWKDTTLVETIYYDGAYNEIWGLPVNNHEIAVIGSTMGTHFIDVTDPTNPIELPNTFVQGGGYGDQLVHRDFHDYRGYLFAVADELTTSTLQIIDIRDLPNSTTVVYDNNEYLIRSHNVFIDSTQAKMYACGISTDTGAWDLSVFDISDPANPIELGVYSYLAGNVNLPYVHDIFVRDNIAYLNCGQQGFYVVDFTDTDNPMLIGSMTDYVQSGYNHSGWLDHQGHYYFMADETHGMDLKVVDVCTSDDIQVVNTFNTDSGIETSIPHNLLLDCNYLYVSWYYEGVQVFDVSDPVNPVRVGYYDTSEEVDTDYFAGNWGVYPYLPSGNILASDMQNGLFILENPFTPDCDNYDATPCDNSIVSTSEIYQPIQSVHLFPQPATEQVNVAFHLEKSMDMVNFELVDLNGKVVGKWTHENLLAGAQVIPVQLSSSLNTGLYFLSLSNEEISSTFKVVIGK